MKQKTALITGASSGIGAEFCKQLVNKGYLVTGVARNKKKLQAIFSDLGEGNTFFTADLGTEEGIEETRQQIAKNKYDVFINNAGFAKYGHFSDINLDEHKSVIDLNVTTLVELSHSYLQNAEKGNTLINVSSIVSRLPYPHAAIYTASKGFVSNFTDSLWYEYKKYGIHVFSLLPGHTRTNFDKVATTKGENDIPSFLTYPVKPVVRSAIKLIGKKRRSSVIGGGLYKFVLPLSEIFVPRKLVILIMGKISESIR